MEPSLEWIGGDGGPLIVLQAGAVPAWQGAVDFDNSLMNGGTVETDYDVICDCEDGVSVIYRHGRDMIVLTDSEWSVCFVPSAADEVQVLQVFGSDLGPIELTARLREGGPSATHAFVAEDATLRLLVGAEGGEGEIYGYAETAIMPGPKVCEVYSDSEAQLAVLRPA